MVMRNVFILLLLSMTIPLVGMQQRVANACMLYAAPTKQDAYSALMKGGMVAAQMASHHPALAPYIDTASRTALSGAFVVPALIAWNSEAIKNGIMKQLPELSAPTTYCLDTGIKKTLFWGGTLAAGYLLYTQTWQKLTKKDLENIFEPQIKQSKTIKKLAQTNKAHARDIKLKAQAFIEQIERNMDAQDRLERSTEQQHSSINSITDKLKKNDATYTSLLAQLNKFIKEINIEELSREIASIEESCKEGKTQSSKELQNIKSQTASNHKAFMDKIKDRSSALTQRYETFKMLSESIDEDITTLLSSVIEYAQALHKSRELTKIALKHAGRIEAAITARNEFSDSESDASSDSESESESEAEDFFAPRGQGGSKKW